MSANTEVVAPLDITAAGLLDGRIRRMAGTIRESWNTLVALVDMAKAGDIHVALGFPSWTAYLADALGGQLDLGTDTRRAVVELLAGEGMSQRAIAQAVGVSQKTVDRDLDHVSQIDSPAEPAPVTGLDGKTYSPPPVKTDVAQRDDIDDVVDWQMGGRPGRTPRRRPITSAFDEQVCKISKLVGSLERLSEDRRFDRNRESLGFRQSDLVRARDALNRVLAKFDEAEAVAG